MEKQQLDALDRDIVSMLGQDGQLSVNQMAEQAGVTGPTVRTHMKNLIAKGVLRVMGLVNPFRTKGFTLALVGLTVQDHTELDAKLDQIAALERVQWAAVVTGGFDILVEVLLSDEIADLYHFINKDLSQVGGVRSSETFVVMQARNKWVAMPKQTGIQGRGQ
ncbi:MAG: Lrp/AsnC family transcriptional regulator [Desulfovibrio sp.]|nr:MAG: Lrp/AsnC family transcriptional regulator [Desulfovibrio sp.]